MEYEIAVELGKPVFVFVATDDCTLDAAPDEPEELRGLQLEHLKRIVASDRIRMPFHSLGHLTDQVRVMRFDAESLAQGVTTRLAVLLTAELIDAGSLRERRGEAAVGPRRPRALPRPAQTGPHPLERHPAVGLADRLSGQLRDRGRRRERGAGVAPCATTPRLAQRAPGLRVGIDVGQVVRFGSADDSHTLQAGQALSVSRRLSQLASGRPDAPDSRARSTSRGSTSGELPIPGDGTASELRWRAHGRYMLAGFDEPLDVCEVGVEGQAPLPRPRSRSGCNGPTRWRSGGCGDGGPRPARRSPAGPAGSSTSKLGEGGFGEVWVARHDRTKEPRVFKFCFDANRLTSFKRELTLFRLLREALGKREDIARLLEVELDQAAVLPRERIRRRGQPPRLGVTGGRLAALPLEERLRLVAEIAEAVAAAHSVGIIHKDLKPSNVFMRQDADGRWHPMLADFGIGAVADRSQLERRGITVAGFTQSLLEPGSSRTGTRMYQPPEANLARAGHRPGRRLRAGRAALPDGHRRLRSASRASAGSAAGSGPRRGWEGEAPSEPSPQTAAPVSPVARPLRR